MVDKFGNFAKQEPIFPDSERIEFSKLIKKEITIKKVEFLPSSYGGEFCVALIDLEGKEYSTAIGSKVVVEQIRKFQEKLPFKATPTELKSKDGRMYQSLS